MVGRARLLVGGGPRVSGLPQAGVPQRELQTSEGVKMRTAGQIFLTVPALPC